MEWIFDHIQLLLVIAGSVAYWLNQRRQAQAGEGAPPQETIFEDPELAERTRKIREEIQRKIEQRARGYANEQPTLPSSQQSAEPPPIVREVVTRQQPAPAVLRRDASHLEAQRMAEILEQQAALTEQLRQAQKMKAAAARRIQFETQISSDKGDIAAAVSRGALADDLRNPDALRRAFILREILGPPVALRR
ncbi:MAG: hypothetical protein EXS42_00080 [Lacunisphaera sp.]|nr:hypothetical protein [Lacunisphaera sp.]